MHTATLGRDNTGRVTASISVRKVAVGTLGRDDTGRVTATLAVEGPG